MKNNIETLQNLYLSPHKKHSYNPRKIYSNNQTYNMKNKQISKTLRNHENKDQINTSKEYNHTDRSMGNKNKRYLLQKYKNTKNTIVQYKSKQKLEKFNQNNSQNIKNISKLHQKSTKHTNISYPHTQHSHSRDPSSQSHQQTLTCSLRLHHLQGLNCKIILLHNPSTQQQHYIYVDKLSDIYKYLKQKYPRIKYYKSMPSQLTVDYFMIEGDEIDGRFLNGQVLYLKPCGQNQKKGKQDGYKRESRRYSTNNQKITFQSFQIVKYLGAGGFSKVFLCRYKQTGKFYAMKIIDKQFIIKNKKKQIIMNERNVMKSSKQNFIIQMKYAFQSQKFLVFVMQYCPGGQLFGLVKKYRRIQQDIARFYIIQIFLGLQYLHKQKVVYRDIKPENILLSYDGHVKIADLGLAKPNMFERELAYSFCGSPQYMSPEMILQIGHTYPVDYYCMGALLYELLTGLPPFYSRDPDEIYEKVLTEQVQIPEDVKLTRQCESLLRALLCKDPKKRLGSLHGIKQILAHPWFGKNTYKKFTQKQISPPISYNCITKVNLDNNVDQKYQKMLQDIRKQQKNQSLQFKQIMKDFYYDYREQEIRIMNKNKRSLDINLNSNSKQTKENTSFNRRKLSTKRLNDQGMKINQQRQIKSKSKENRKEILISLKQNQEPNFSKLYQHNYYTNNFGKNNQMNSTLKRMSYKPKKLLASSKNNETNSSRKLLKNVINTNKF